jgi:hypothetical protein
MRGGRPKELARRIDSDGVEVSLRWRRADGRLTVVVTDLNGHHLNLPAKSDNALDVYYHPFAYAGRSAFEKAA